MNTIAENPVSDCPLIDSRGGNNPESYESFLARKAIVDRPSGFTPSRGLNPKLFEFQKDVVSWGLRRGRAAFFEDCGLGKTPQQLEWSRQVFEETGENVLLLTPLAVAAQHIREARKFGIEHIKQCADQSEVVPGITVTNYEKLHRFDASRFVGIGLDESSILKSYDGKFRNLLIESFRRTPYKSAWTATPAPNDHMELGNHAEFLGVMTRSEMLATFFTHDGGDTSKWRLKGHAEEAFWKWLASWAVNIRKPSDLGYSDEGFTLPELEIKTSVVESDCQSVGFLFPLPASSLHERREARRGSLDKRAETAIGLANSDREQWLVWCDLNDESKALAAGIDGAVEVTGSDSDEHKAEAMLGFADGSVRVLVSKPGICGFGMNFQNSSRSIFCGLSDSYERFYQAVRRQYRFGQTNKVTTHIITSNLEGAVVENIRRKQADADRMAAAMVKHMAELSAQEIHQTRRDSIAYRPAVSMQLPQWMGRAA